jgi:hypothetical protein
MRLLAALLLVLAGIYLVVERGQSRSDRIFRWMVITGAVAMAILIGGGYFR